MKTPIMHPSAGYIAESMGSERLLEAVRAFIAAFSTPPLPLEHIYPGDANLTVLPAGSSDYAVFWLIDQQTVGTPVENYRPDGSTVVGSYVRARVQVDIYSDAGMGYDNARARAQTLSTLARTPTGVGFFDRYGINCLFCDFASSSPVITDSNARASRWTVTLNLAFWQWTTINLDYFTGIVDRVQNVDVAFHPEDIQHGY